MDNNKLLSLIKEGYSVEFRSHAGPLFKNTFEIILRRYISGTQCSEMITFECMEDANFDIVEHAINRMKEKVVDYEKHSKHAIPY